MYPIFADAIGDTVLSYNLVQTAAADKFYGSLRLYDSNFNVIKEALIKKNLYQMPYSCLLLKNKNIIASAYSLSGVGNTVGISSFYLYDRRLNPIAWPTTPPAKGYDWACKTSIPAFEIIDLHAVTQPVFVKPDTTRPDWKWLTGIASPTNATIAKKDNGWFIWPHPALPGGDLHFRSISNQNFNNFEPLYACFYDIEGNEIMTATAVHEGNGQWVIPSLSLSMPGTYMVVLTNKYTGVAMGSVKVVVK